MLPGSKTPLKSKIGTQKLTEPPFSLSEAENFREVASWYVLGRVKISSCNSKWFRSYSLPKSRVCRKTAQGHKTRTEHVLNFEIFPTGQNVQKFYHWKYRSWSTKFGQSMAMFRNDLHGQIALWKFPLCLVLPQTRALR